ncbi:MAG: cation-transporting P-type ATPase [Candidatus Binatia bacterium]
MPARPLPLLRVELASPECGLTTSEAERLRSLHGPNDVVETTRHPWRGLVADTARDPMLWFLVATSVLYAIIGDTMEAVTLALAIIPLALMDAYLHHRTVASTTGLRSRLAAHARVLRDGNEIDVTAGALVPGDLVLAGAGTVVPADGVWLAAHDLMIDESSLTGESEAVRKHVLATLPPNDRSPVDGTHWGHAGTRVLAGRGRLRVAYTGAETLYGQIVRAAASTPTRTALQRAITRVVLLLTGAAVVACLSLALVRVHQGHGWVDAAVSALTLAVAALPEELPVVFTFFLGVGTLRLARRHALVRRAAAVENIGRITTICSDKTGTLTEGRLVLTHLVAAAGVESERFAALVHTSARSESSDPLDLAILARPGAAPQAGIRVATFPFTEERKRETVVTRNADGTLLAITKGALETLLPVTTLDDAARMRCLADAEALATAGHKIVACAFRALLPAWDGIEPESGLTFAGLLALEDPVRPGVADAIQRCRAAGVNVIMVTGDHPLTATAVARELGLGGTTPKVVTGDDLEAAIAAGTPLDVNIVARATPTQKLALVRALQRAGEVVAVTGDGVNDVPALQTADVGIAMGERGTQSAREVAAIVLLDDDFATIAGAIAEGRQLFHNLRRSFQYLLMMHIPFVGTAALIPMMGQPLLYLPLHVVWLELVMHPTALLAFQAPSCAATLTPRVRRVPTHLLHPDAWLAVAVVGVALLTFVAGGFLRTLAASTDVGQARAIALLTLCFSSSGLAAVLSGLQTRAARIVTASTALLSLLAVLVPGVALRLDLSPLRSPDILTALALALVTTTLAILLERYEAVGRIVE